MPGNPTSKGKAPKDASAKHPLLKGRADQQASRSEDPLSLLSKDHKARAASTSADIPSKITPKPDVNTVDSDEEQVVLTVIKSGHDGNPPSSIEFEAAEGYTSTQHRRSGKTKRMVDSSLTIQDIIDLKASMKEYSQIVKQDFLTIMSKLNTIELNIQTLQTDMEIFKKSSARFVSSGPAAGVSVTRKIDW